MRLTALLLAAAFLLVQVPGMSQSITFSGKEVAMKKVFQVIEQQTGYMISGDRSILTSAKPVSVSVENLPVQQFLDLVFRDQDISYRMRGNNIFLSRKEQLPVSPQRIVAATDSIPIRMTGTVRSRSGELLADVSVKVKGLPTGSITNAQGLFFFGIQKNTILEISSIGYETVEIGVREVAGGFTAYAVRRSQQDNVKATPGKPSLARL